MRGIKPAIGDNGGPPIAPCPKAPAWLAPYAKAEWKRVAPILHERGILAMDTIAMLESYVTNVALVREAEETMATEGRIVDGKPHGAFRIQSIAMKEARLLAAELGLTPHRRPKQGQQDDDGGDLAL